MKDIIIFENSIWKIVKTDKVDVIKKKTGDTTTVTIYDKDRYGLLNPEKLPKYIHKQLIKYAKSVNASSKIGSSGKPKNRIKGGHPVATQLR